jgi:hypothetical protein
MKKLFTLLAIALLTATFTFAQTVIWQNTATPIFNVQYGTNSGSVLGQQFIVTSPNTSIQEVTLYISKNDDVATDYIVSIYKDNGSNQIGTKVADIASNSNSNLSYTISTVSINSANCLNNALPLTLNAGSKYWITLTTSNDQTIWWCYDESNSTINGTGASNICYMASYVAYSSFFMKITAGAPVLTALDKTTSDEVSVETSAKTISINSVFGNYTVEVINAIGSKVLSQQVTQSGSTTIAVDAPHGFYFVKVSAEGRYFTKKVFLQ